MYANEKLFSFKKAVVKCEQVYETVKERCSHVTSYSAVVLKFDRLFQAQSSKQS